jgi:predicted DNA-binding protein
MREDVHMRAAERKSAANKAPHRLSVSLTVDQYQHLSELARKNRVSVAWVVREAIERLLRDDMPLLHVGKE